MSRTFVDRCQFLEEPVGRSFHQSVDTDLWNWFGLKHKWL